MLCLVDTILWSSARDMDNYKMTVFPRLDDFEMWSCGYKNYCRVLKISWTENVNNEEALRRTGTGSICMKHL